MLIAHIGDDLIHDLHLYIFHFELNLLIVNTPLITIKRMNMNME